tara:strand:- start:126 stop:773 length:648 start_codon:yes stop_codon:yes gene_type:complete
MQSIKDNMFVDDERKIIFIHIAKTGGSSIHVALKDAMKWPMGDPRRDDPLPPKHHISVIDLIRENPRYAGYYKFAVVREPLDRLRSAYTDFLTDSGRSNYHMSLREYDNFEHFCQNFTSTQWPQDPHFRPQHEMVCDSNGNIIVDLCRYENLTDDLIRIGDKLGFSSNPFNVHKLGHHRNYKDRRESIDLKLTNETEARIKDFFAKDYEIFGYTP